MECETLKLKEVLDYDQPNPFIVTSPIKKEKTNIPVLTANKGFIKGYTDDTEGIYENVPVIIFDDFTTNLKFVDFPFKVKSSAMKILKLKRTDVSIKYVYYQMASKQINSSTHKRYYISVYQNLDFIFPINKNKKIDLPKQKHLVGEIEIQFTRLDSAIKSLQTIKKKLEIYRKSILRSSFEGGRFSKEEFQEINLFNFILKIPLNWDTGPLSSLGTFGRGKSKHRPRNDPVLFNGKYPFVQTGEISRANGGKLNNYSKTYNEIGLKQSKLWSKGTLCITIAANIAKTAVLDIDACFPDSVVGFCSKDKYTTLFVKYYLDFVQQILDNKASATAQKNINLNILTNMIFPTPDSSVREQVVQEIEIQFSVIDKLEETVNASLLKVETFRKSILKSAFDGKLVRYNNND